MDPIPKLAPNERQGQLHSFTLRSYVVGWHLVLTWFVFRAYGLVYFLYCSSLLLSKILISVYMTAK